MQEFRGARFQRGFGEINGLGEDPLRRTGLEAECAQTRFPQGGGKILRCQFPVRTARCHFGRNHVEPGHVCAGSQHDGIGSDAGAVLQGDAPDRPVFHIQMHGHAGQYGQVGLMGADMPHHSLVFQFVRLNPQGPHTGSLGAVEHLELQGRTVCRDAHLAAQRVDFTHNNALGRTADRGVAGHLADVFHTQCQQHRPVAEPGRRQGCLNAGMTAADNYNFVITHG